MLSSPVTSETVWLPPPHLWWAEEHFCLACGVFSPRHRTLVSLSTYIIFFTHTSAYCPTPSTFNHIKSSPPPPPNMALSPQLHFKLPGYTLSSISLGYRNGGMPGKGIKLGEKMHSKTPMGQFIPAVLFSPLSLSLSFSLSILNILQSLDWHDKAILMPGLG